jgi:hypothetical protein
MLGSLAALVVTSACHTTLGDGPLLAERKCEFDVDCADASDFEIGDRQCRRHFCNAHRCDVQNKLDGTTCAAWEGLLPPDPGVCSAGDCIRATDAGIDAPASD